MNELPLYVIDDRNPVRGDKVRENALLSKHFSKAENKQQSSILAVHYKDGVRFKDNKALPLWQRYPNKLLVVYSGGNLYSDLNEADKKSNRVLVIDRFVEAGSPITRPEWQWIYRNIDQDKNRFYKTVLRQELTLLPALSLLCQGFLGILIRDGQITDKEVCQLIRENKDSPGFIPDIIKGVNKVTAPGWWQALRNIKSLEEMVAMELKANDVPTPIRELLQRIESNESINVESYITVANAYREIIKGLE